jgi:tripartite-type tricarboxylate transporter receptor subunit TctC
MRNWKKLGCAIAAYGLAGCNIAAAQDWPNRPLTMVVPFAAGGPVDVLGRLLQPSLGEALGQQVIIENISGAGGMVGSLRVSQAPPDSHQFVLGSIGTHALNQALYKKPLYNVATDFAPVILIADAPLVLIVRKDLPANSLQEFIAYAKANQSKMQYGSGGTGTSAHIGCVLLNQAIGVDITHVPYRGGGPAMQDLIAGRIDYVCNYVSTALPAVQGHTAKVVATLARARSTAFPDIGTAHEQGLKDFDVSAWNAMFMPKSTPAPIVGKLNAAASRVLDTPAVRKRLDDIGLIVATPERRSSQYLAKFVAGEIEKWTAPIKASGLSAD